MTAPFSKKDENKTSNRTARSPRTDPGLVGVGERSPHGSRCPIHLSFGSLLRNNKADNTMLY